MSIGSYLFVAMWFVSVSIVSTVVLTLWRKHISPAAGLGLAFGLFIAALATIAEAVAALTLHSSVPAVFATLTAATFMGGFSLFLKFEWKRGDTVVVAIYYTTMIASLVSFIFW